jgi:hypothetical protein
MSRQLRISYFSLFRESPALSTSPPAAPNIRRCAGIQRWRRFRPRRRGIEFGQDRPQSADTRRERVTVVLDDIVKLLGESGGGRRDGSAIHAALHYWPPPVVGALITTQRVLASGLP